jgi:hypothetical protein
VEGTATAVYLYDEGTCAALTMEGVARAVQETTGLGVEVRPEFVSFWGARARADRGRLGEVGRRLAEGYPDSLARALVAARVCDPLRRLQPERLPTSVELAAERRSLGTPGRASVGVLYDGARVQWLMAEMMGDRPGPDDPITAVHVVITGRLLGTWAEADSRWHAHTILLGEPALISTSGLVQAPARPREYYQAQTLATARLVPRELAEAELRERLADRMLLPDDPRMTQVVTGYVLQAIAFWRTGSAFCPTPTCRLYNARRQEELLRAQSSPEARLCPEHEAVFAALRRPTR